VIVYPAIDIYGGRVVRMTRGDFSTVEEVAPSPLEAAKRLVNEGAEWLHIVDIDGARTGEPANLDAIRQIANRFTVKIQAGGGIRDFDTAEQFAEAGASRIIVGTAAIEDPELIARRPRAHSSCCGAFCQKNIARPPVPAEHQRRTVASPRHASDEHAGRQIDAPSARTC